jgi:hypothetical protein
MTEVRDTLSTAILTVVAEWTKRAGVPIGTTGSLWPANRAGMTDAEAVRDMQAKLNWAIDGLLHVGGC